MVNTLALVMAVALVPGANDDELKISNIRSTYGQLGPVRPQLKVDKVLPGDIYFVTWDMEPFKLSARGFVKLSLALKVTDSKGHRMIKQDPVESVQVNSLGGDRVPGFANVIIGSDTAPGLHTMEVTVEDKVGKKVGSFKRDFEILPRGFGIIRLRTSVDVDGVTSVPPIGVVGQQLFVNFFVIGADTAKGTKAPHISVQMEVLDEDGKPTLKKPEVVESKEQRKDADALPVSLMLALNRAGKFRVKLTATDENNKNVKPVEVSFLVSVHDLK